jgi:hypothetical protein
MAWHDVPLATEFAMEGVPGLRFQALPLTSNAPPYSPHRDRPQSVPYDPYPAAFVPPFHYRNPVSGRADHYRDPSWRDSQTQ